MKNIYPKVGDTFYWKDIDGDIHEDVCLKIEAADNPDLETMFFIRISKNGGGGFITESDIISPTLKEVKEFKERKVQEKLKEISNYISQEEVRCELYNKLRKNHFSEDDAEHILNILGNND